jgi:PAS domain S-box-containing protein
LVVEKFVTVKTKQVRVQNTIEIVEDGRDVVWAMDKDFHLTTFNHSFRQKFKEELGSEPQVGMNLRPVYKESIFFSSCTKGCERALNSNATTAKHTVDQSGTTRVNEFAFQPYMDKSGAIMGCCIWQKDVTQEVENIQRLEESEKKYGEVQEITNVGHWSWDMLKNEITWSDQLFSIFGQVPGEFEATYEALMEIIHPEDRQLFNEDVERCIKKNVMHDIVHRIVINEGEVRYVHQKGKAYYDEEKKPYRVSGTTQDVTKDVQANQQIVQQNNELQNFVRIISHNLRGPISNLLMLSKIYEWGKDEENDDIVRKIENTTEALDQTIKDLNLSLSMKNTDKERFRQVRLAEVIKDVDVLLSEEVSKTQAVIRTDFSQVESILGLKSYFVNIFYNLIMNSIKYQQEGLSPLITIFSQKVEDGVILSISDNGIGIELTPEKERKIFDMYGRLSGATDGKGLGLYLVKTQVEAMDGKISVQSTKGDGTTFTLHFPK